LGARVLERYGPEFSYDHYLSIKKLRIALGLGAVRWVYLYRAIDQYGQVIDVLVSEKRDLAATRRFFTRALEHGPYPTEVSTDRAPAYPQVVDELLPTDCHIVEQYAPR
jgi:transposase-like protein